MSIIYNALQKAQRNRQNEAMTKTRQALWRDRILLSSIALLLAVALYGYMPDLMEHAKHSARAKQIAATQHETTVAIKPTPVVAENAQVQTPAKPKPSFVNLSDYKNSHILGGVYLSDEEKIALINNKFFHLGDTIDGMKLVSIEPNRIILRYADNAVILQTEQIT